MGWIVFNRPGSGNAMNAAMIDELEAAWRELDADPQVGVIVNTGTGRAFQTGLDVVELAQNPEALREQSRRTKRAELRLTAWHNGVGKPVIAAVNGVCAGGGLHFVADADIVIASSNATFLDPHVSIGQVTAFEAIGLIRKMPVEAVMRMALVGRYERIDAARAYQLGMISQIVDPPEKLREAAQELAEKIAKNSPAAMAATKRALWGALELGLTDACKAGAKELVSVWGHPDQEEGPRAFAEKREPQWVDPVGASRVLEWGAARVRRAKCRHEGGQGNGIFELREPDVERHGQVGWLLNNRPDQLNAMNTLMRDEFAQAWIELDRDPEVRVIVHTGEGRAFQTGVDVTELATDGEGMERYRESVEELDIHFTAWHQKVCQAGDHRGQRDLRRWRLPLDRRRRHRDRRIRRPVLRPARLHRPGRAPSRPSG